MERIMFELLLKEQERKETARVLAQNARSQGYGLSLTQEDAAVLVAEKNRSLRAERRVEFGETILPELINVFCDSPYLEQDHYRETLSELADIFFQYKNEADDRLTDAELLAFMKEQFDGVCFGSAEYLAGTCLERFARAIRAGYEGYRESGGKGEYEALSEEARWDREIYLEALFHELI